MKIQTLTVLPSTPKELDALKALSYNLYFSWNEEVGDLFASMDSDLWAKCHKNPVQFLAEVPADTLKTFAKDKAFLSRLEAVHKNFTAYCTGESWYDKNFKRPAKENIAYFCCEFGLDASLPVYSGGLGILSGDHIKTASDMGLPLVGVGLFYYYGYFVQQIDMSGEQIEHQKINDIYTLPITPVADEKGEQRVFTLALAGEEISYYAWKLSVGRTSVYLLDTRVPSNPQHIQDITAVLYDRNRETRIRQEYLLGVGGFQVLKALGYEIDVFHLNEGHSAFLLLEYIRDVMKNHGLDFESAKYFVINTVCFTTHTPVPAGNERFSIDLIDKYFAGMLRELGISRELFLSLGRENPEDAREEFCLTVLALKLSDRNNGVSKLHGEVSRAMWKNLYPGVMTDEVPIASITNGVHGQTWTDRDLKEKLQAAAKKAAPRGDDGLYDARLYHAVQEIGDAELWSWKNKSRTRLVQYARQRVMHRYIDCNAGQLAIERAAQIFNPDALTIGFARRFATYKRGDLFFRDPQRLKNILCDAQHPVQMIIAGKAHPADRAGKDIIRAIHDKARQYGLEDRIIFIENYGINVARHLVSGVDVWLNNPVKPMEASGTSGMKAAMNGSLNLSIADGWWAEGYRPTLGWRLDTFAETGDQAVLDALEADRFYNYLETEVVPLFYAREEDGVPHKWVAMMKESIMHIGAEFNSVRMVEEYVRRCYEPAAQSARQLRKDTFASIAELNRWRVELYRSWPQVRIVSLEKPQAHEHSEAREVTVEARVELGDLTPSDVAVQCCHGPLDAASGSIRGAGVIDMKHEGTSGALHRYSARIEPKAGGKYGYTARVLPKHKYLTNPLSLNLIRWFE